MSWFDRFRRQKRPRQKMKSGPRSPDRRAYDAAGDGYRTSGWQTSGQSANAEVAAGLGRTRERSRDLVRNTAWGRRAIEALVCAMIGPGIRPMLNTGDEALDRRVQNLWDAWSPSCYSANRSNIYTLQSLIARAFFESGECLVRRVIRPVSDMPGLPPLQLQVIEGDLLDHTYRETPKTGSSHQIIQGIEFDADNHRVAYHLYRNHPGDTYGGFALERVSVPASEILHLYQEGRPGQVRGIPWLHAVIPAVWDLAGYSDSERVRAKCAASVMAFVTGGDPESGVPSGVDGMAPAIDSDGALVTDTSGNPIEHITPGWIAHLPIGKDVVFNHPGTADGYSDYVRASLKEISAGIGLSYATLTGDMSDSNFAQSKLGQNQQNQLIRSLREQVFVPMVMAPIWRWWVDLGIAAGLLPDAAEIYDTAWSQPQAVSVDRLADAQADKIEMRNATRCRREIIAASGRDPDDVDREIEKDQENRDRMGIVTDGDPRQTTNAGLTPAGLDATENRSDLARPHPPGRIIEMSRGDADE